MNKPIVLVGMMGAGKTTIGTRLAKRLNLPFIDTDDEIKLLAGCSLTDIFKYQGEEYFTQLERKVIENKITSEPMIVATGGSTFIDTRCRQIIKDKTISIWLKADLEVLIERVSRRNTRPILEQGNKRDLVTAMLKERYSIYAEADLEVQSDGAPHHVIVDEVINLLKGFVAKKA